MAKIKVLDDSTIQKIAAGEVIERPASVVKEFVENSIDANADKIIVEIKNGGKTLIRVSDNGDGFEKEDLSLAFKKHSTSKLNTIDDLYNILSLGFRGEALSSISSIAKVEVLTKTKGAYGGIQAMIEEGKILSMDTVGCPEGTTMIARDIFYNIPVRKKFLKSDLAEGNQISELINRMALGNPGISFSLIRDHKTILKTSKNDNLLKTIYRLLGKDYSSNLIPVDHADEYIKIEGFISNNNLYRGNRNHQYIYINGRPIINYGISKVIENNYKTLIPINRFPIFILNIKIDPREIDVNIHPTKQEIKFVNSDKVYGKLNYTIKNNLMECLDIPKMTLGRNEKVENDDMPKLFKEETTIEGNKAEEIRIYDLTTKVQESEPIDVFGQDSRNNINSNFQYSQNRSNKIDKEKDSSLPASEFEPALSKVATLDIKPLGRVFSTYIILEIGEENKMLFIDQHAAHERVMYEKYKKEFENEGVVVQQLIYPEIVNLTNKEKSDFNSNIEIFKNLGFDIDDFGPTSLAIRGVPFLFGEPNIKELFLDLLDGLNNQPKTSYDTKPEKIMKIACTKAVKSGDNLTDMEIISLYKDLLSCSNPHTCPHGRPTMIELSKRDIEKQFLRIN